MTDAARLAKSEFSADKAMVIYGFDYPNQSVDTLIEAFETLADRRVELGPRYEIELGPLVHPVHAAGRVFGWRIGQPRYAPRPGPVAMPTPGVGGGGEPRLAESGVARDH